MGKLTFNDHLDDMMQRLMNEDLSASDLEREIKRSKALCQIAEKKIEDKKVTVQALQTVGDFDFVKGSLPAGVKQMLQIEDDTP